MKQEIIKKNRELQIQMMNLILTILIYQLKIKMKYYIIVIMIQHLLIGLSI